VSLPREERNWQALVTAGLRDVAGWQILALYLEGKLTAKQAQAVNSRRVRLLSGDVARERA